MTFLFLGVLLGAVLLVGGRRRPSFAAALVAAAREDLGRGEEPPGSNLGPYVAELGAPWGLAPPFNYCAAAVASWLARAQERSGIPSPILGSTLSKANRDQLQAAGLWVDAADLGGRFPAPGALLVWDRGTPEHPERGHIGVLEQTGPTPITIEANHGPAVARVERSWTDPTLLGVGLLGGWA